MVDSPSRPNVLAPLFDNIPHSLRALPRWVGWRLVLRDGRWTKVPVNARTGGPASSTNQSTWATFDEARAAYQRGGLDGVGFVFNGDGLVGVDFDKVRDPATGEIRADALQAIHALGSWGDLSPSGTGVHVLVRARKPGGQCRRGGLEIYERGRFFTMTGHPVPGAPSEVADAQAALDQLHADTFGAPAVAAHTAAAPAPGRPSADGVEEEEAPAPADVDAAELRVLRWLEERHGRFVADPAGDVHIAGCVGRFENPLELLWGGWPDEYDGDHSRADLALCNYIVAAGIRGEARVDAVFRRSGLMRPKWDEKRGELTYGQGTMRMALEGQPTPAPLPAETEATLRQIEALAIEDPGAVLKTLLQDESAKAALRSTGEERVLLFEERCRAAKVPVQRLERAVQAIRAGAPASASAQRGENFSKAPAVARELMRHNHFLCVGGGLYVYRMDKQGRAVDGRFRPDAEHFVRVEVHKIRRDENRSDFENEVIKWLCTETRRTSEELDQPPVRMGAAKGEIINVANGLLNLRTGELHPHTPEFCSLVQLPVEWRPDAKFPLWDETLEQILPDPTERALLWEFAGYCLLPDCRFERALLLSGEGQNGKSTWLGGLERTIGKESVSSASLQSLGENRFVAAQLFGKLVNVGADLPKTALQDVGLFKLLVSGETVMAEHKGRDHFQFRNRAKLVFSANELPDTPDRSDAFFRRWLIVEFKKKYWNRNELPAGGQGGKLLIADPTLKARLYTPEGLSYFLKLAVEGLRRLVERGDFAPSQRMLELKAEYRTQQDPVRAFADEHCRLDAGESTPKKKLHDEFVGWAGTNRIRPTQSREFFKRLYRAFPDLTDAKEGPRDSREPVVKGIALL